MTDALGQPTQYSYDNVGNLLSIIDREGNTTTYTYDAINRRITMTDAQPATTQYQYDNVGNLLKLTDANLHATSYTYDAVIRRLTEKYPDLTHNTITYTYDMVGNRISRTDTFTYDLSGRVLTGNTNRSSSWNESFAYDGANRVIQSVQNGRTISYGYDIPARIRTLTYPRDRSSTEQMDFREQLATVNDGSITQIAQYTYDPAERILTRGYRNGIVATYAYNANNWVCSLTHNFGASLIVGFTYAYDNEGNKFYEQKPHQMTDSEAYTYDPVYRLTDYQAGMLAASPPPNCPAGPVGIPLPATQTAYNLDKLGNWNSIVVTPDGTQTRTHSPSNEITSIHGFPVGSLTILSDNNGNTSDDGTNLYSYDEENRLAKVTAKPTSAVLGQYQHDTFGRRVSKIDNLGVQAFYYYDGWRTIEEQSSTGVTQATYVFGNYLDELLTMDRIGESGPFYYHQNTLWSTFALSDSTGKGVEGYSYDAYGYQTVILPGLDGILWTSDDVILPGAKSSYGNPFLFTGQRYDPETGLYYYRACNYDTFKARFLQRDPLGYESGYNLYEYVDSNPTNRLDPAGTEVTSSKKEGVTYLDDQMRYSIEEEREYQDLQRRLGNLMQPENGPLRLTRAQRERLTERLKERIKEYVDSHAITGFFNDLKDFEKEFTSATTYYIDGSDTPSQFAEHAARCGKECAVSLYFGHEIGGGLNAPFLSNNPLGAATSVLLPYAGTANLWSTYRAGTALNSLAGAGNRLVR